MALGVSVEPGEAMLEMTPSPAVRLMLRMTGVTVRYNSTDTDTQRSRPKQTQTNKKINKQVD